MIEFEEALNLILNNTHVLPIEQIPVEKSIGRILKEDINSTIYMPPFNKSAMDGYAVKSKDIQKAPVELKCLGLIQAGQAYNKEVKTGECVKIMTGAPLPVHTDCVVMVENTKVAKDNNLPCKKIGKGIGRLPGCNSEHHAQLYMKNPEYIQILKQAKKLENVCIKGEDIQKGIRVLNKDTCLSPSHIAIISAAGKKLIKTIRKPEVAILNTGGEIVPPGLKLGKNKIYNSNGPMLSALLNSDNILCKYSEIVRDNEKELLAAIKKGLKYDILLISGGVSMGDYDLVPGILKKLGVRKKFHNIRMKPGKPFYFGIKDNTLVFGIPGNPVSNFLAYYVFIQPVIKKMMGYKSPGPEFHDGIFEKEYKQKTGRKHFVLIKISKKQGQYYLRPVKSHGSADIQALSKADGFMIVDKNTALLKKNSGVKFITW